MQPCKPLSMLHHHAAILHHVHAVIHQLLCHCFVANAALKPDDARARCDEVGQVGGEVMRSAEQDGDVHGSIDGGKAVMHALAEDLPDFGVVHRYRDHLETCTLQISGYVMRGLRRQVFRFDADNRNAVATAQDGGDVCSGLQRAARRAQGV